MLNTNKMKSTVKMTYESSVENNPVIRIVIPESIIIEDDPDDVRDKHVRDFITSPLYSEPNQFFEVKTAFPIESQGVFVTTIGPIKPDQMLFRFRHAILNRFVSYDSIVKLNSISGSDRRSRPAEKGEADYDKIHEFFDYLDELTFEQERTI